MSAQAFAALLFLAPTPTLVPDVAFEDLAADRNAAAIVQIEGNQALDADDPARLINLGVAYAREGQVEAAHRLFTAVLHAERFNLETAQGEWIDSRALARRALAALDRGEFVVGSRTAMR